MNPPDPALVLFMAIVSVIAWIVYGMVKMLSRLEINSINKSILKGRLENMRRDIDYITAEVSKLKREKKKKK